MQAGSSCDFQLFPVETVGRTDRHHVGLGFFYCCFKGGEAGRFDAVTSLELATRFRKRGFGSSNDTGDTDSCIVEASGYEFTYALPPATSTYYDSSRHTVQL